MLGLVLSLCALLCSALSLAHSGHSVLVGRKKEAAWSALRAWGPVGDSRLQALSCSSARRPGNSLPGPVPRFCMCPLGITGSRGAVHLRRPLHGSPLASARFWKRSLLALPRPLDLPSPAPLRGGEEGVCLRPAWRRRQRPPGGWSPPVLQNEEGGPGGALRGRSLHPVVGPFLPAPRPPRGAPALNQFGRAGRVWRWAGSPEPPRLPGRLLPPPAARRTPRPRRAGRRALEAGESASPGVAPPKKGARPRYARRPSGRGALPGAGPCRLAPAEAPTMARSLTWCCCPCCLTEDEKAAARIDQDINRLLLEQKKRDRGELKLLLLGERAGGVRTGPAGGPTGPGEPGPLGGEKSKAQGDQVLAPRCGQRAAGRGLCRGGEGGAGPACQGDEPRRAARPGASPSSAEGPAPCLSAPRWPGRAWPPPALAGSRRSPWAGALPTGCDPLAHGFIHSRSID